MGIILDSGKYVIEEREIGKLTFFRNGKPWPVRDQTAVGDKLLYSMFCRIEELEAEKAKAWSVVTGQK